MEGASPSPTTPPAPPTRAAPTWLYGVTTLPFGVASGFAGVAMPFMLRNAGVELEEIAKISAICLVPASWQFLWAPVLDLGPKRKHWLIAMSVLGAACYFVALLLPLRAHMKAFVALAVAGQALTGLVGSCNGGLMATTLPDAVRGRAGGWANAGNLGGAALGAGVIMWFASRLAPSIVGAMTAAMIALPALAALAIHEHPRARRSMRDVFGGLFGSIWSTLRSREGITGILICASPVGTAAAMNLFSGMGPDYHARAGVVTVTNGFAGGLITAVGSLLGGYLCDLIPRRVAYLLSGGATAICALTMSFFPLTETTFIWGVSAYLFIAGFCYSSFSALVLEVVGKAGASASTQYTLFTAAGNQAISYTTVLLGVGAARWGGAPGMLRADALANTLGIVFLGVVMLIVARLARQRAASVKGA